MFETLIGNKNVKEYLTNVIETDNISHSYMFVGKNGVGKHIFAKEFAKHTMCIDKKLKDKCDSCIKFEANSNPDYYELEPDGKTLKIEQIRKMQESIAQKPIISNKKVYIINNAETMTEESQNCLLKTLEEPPEYVIIILIVSNENKMLATIKSRCVIVKFKNLTNLELKTYLPQATDEMIELLSGSLEKVDNIEQKQDEYKKLSIIVESLKHKTLVEVLNNSDILYQQKEGIINLLEYLNIIFFKDKMYNLIEIVEKTKKKIIANNNYEMCIDYLLIHIWEEINENGSRN